jgi:hypothetical protein
MHSSDDVTAHSAAVLAVLSRLLTTSARPAKLRLAAPK